MGTASNLATGTSPAAGSGPEAAGASSVAGSSADDQALGARLAGLARGGPLLEVGLGGLALLLLLIEGDRRMMRRAQRMAMAAFDGAHHPEG